MDNKNWSWHSIGDGKMLRITNRKSGEAIGTGTIERVTLQERVPTLIDDLMMTHKRMVSCSADKSLEFTVTDSEISQQLFDPFDPYMSEKNFMLEIISPTVIPKRTHRKKRINKKWLKRYGFRTCYMTSNDWEIAEMGDDGVVVFEKKS